MTKRRFIVEVEAPADIPTPYLREALIDLVEAGQSDLRLSIAHLDEEERMGAWEEAAAIKKIEVKRRPLPARPQHKR